MKSQQINFYLLPEEQGWFEGILRDCGDFTVVRRLTSSKGLVTTSSTIVKGMGEENLSVYLIRPTDLSQIFTRVIPAKDVRSVDETRSPVVEFSRCYFDGQLLRRGRLYAITHYYDESSQLVAKPESFRKWAKALIATTKKSMTKREDGDFIAPLAKKRVESGEIKLSIL